MKERLMMQNENELSTVQEQFEAVTDFCIGISTIHQAIV
jgi:hypothetical protein